MCVYVCVCVCVCVCVKVFCEILDTACGPLNKWFLVVHDASDLRPEIKQHLYYLIQLQIILEHLYEVYLYFEPLYCKLLLIFDFRNAVHETTLPPKHPATYVMYVSGMFFYPFSLF